MVKPETLLAWVHTMHSAFTTNRVLITIMVFLLHHSDLHKVLTPICNGKLHATKNLGLDYGFLKGKISGSIDLYEKTTTNMVFPYTVAQSIDPSGFLWLNVGKIRNRGVEFSVNVNVVNQKNFSWNTGFNLASNKNVILDLKGPEQYGVNADSTYYTQLDGPGTTGSRLQILAVGGPLGQFYSFQYAGKDASGNSLFLKKDKTKQQTRPRLQIIFHWVARMQN